MFYKTIMVQVTDSKYLNARVEAAATIAARENAHLIAVGLTGVRKFVNETSSASMNGTFAVDLPGLELLRKRTDNALKEAENIALRMGVQSFEKRVIDDYGIEAFSVPARYCDLLILGQPAPDEETTFVDSDFHEQVAVNSSEPTLIMPYAGAYGNIGQRVLIAWNASRQAKRAIHYALPLLQRAKHVQAVIFNPATDSSGIYGIPPGADLKTYLARHGVDMQIETPSTAGDIGEALLSLAAGEGSDLLVMGCYSHSRFRELVLGGTTRTVLKSMTVPVLMSY